MSYIDLGDHPGTTLNLIERMSIVPILQGTAAEVDDPETGTYFRESAFLIQMDSGVEHEIEFRGLANFPVADGETVLFRCVAGLAPGRVIQVSFGELIFIPGLGDIINYHLLNDPVLEGNPEPFLFSGVPTSCAGAEDSYTITKESWETLIGLNTAVNPDDEDDVVRFKIEGTCILADCNEVPAEPSGDPDPDQLSRTWAYFQVSFPYSILDTVDSADPPKLLMRSHSRVLTAKHREPIGENHYHYGALVLDPETGGLLMQHRAGLKIILAGASVSPGGDGRPSEGSLEFRTNGELYGSVTRFATHSPCCPII